MDKPRYRVSALVSTYNSERFMRGRLEDLLGQTLYEKGELEIIVIDSASEEGEGGIVRSFQERFDHIRYERTETRESLYAAWNRGIDMSSAPLLANANTDDRFAPNGLELLTNAVEREEGIGFAYGDFFLSTIENETFEENDKRKAFGAQDYCPPSLLLHHVPGHLIVWRKALHDALGRFDETLRAAGDYDFFLRVACRRRGYHLGEPVGLVFQRSDSLTYHDFTMGSETSEVLARHRQPRFALDLYAAAGVPTGTVEEKARCFIDLGNRALAYYPLLRGGKANADLSFAEGCYEWAESCVKGVSCCEAELRQALDANRRVLRSLEGKLWVSGEEPLLLWWPVLGLGRPEEGVRECRPVFGDREVWGGGAWEQSEGSLERFWASCLGCTEEIWRVLSESQNVEASIVIWGASERGRQWMNALASRGVKVSAFVDSDGEKTGRMWAGVPALSLRTALQRFGDRSIFLIAVGEFHRPAVVAELEKAGVESPARIVCPG